MRKIFYGHCIQEMQKITDMFTKTLCTMLSKFTPINVSHQSILYFYMYCMGQEKKLGK